MQPVFDSKWDLLMALLGSFHQAFLGDFDRSDPFRTNELFSSAMGSKRRDKSGTIGEGWGSFEPFPLKVDK